MEARACGLPVIATAVGGLPKVLVDCDGAILIKPQSSEEIIKSLDCVINNRKKLDMMSVMARKKAVACFGLENNARQVIQHLSKTVEEFKIGR